MSWGRAEGAVQAEQGDGGPRRSRGCGAGQAWRRRHDMGWSRAEEAMQAELGSTG